LLNRSTCLKVLCLHFFLVFTFSLAAQKNLFITGILVDSVSKEPLPFANIGIVKKNVGGITDDRGEFLLTIPNQYRSDTLTFRYVGYEEVQIPVARWLTAKRQEVFLKPKTDLLEEVLINAKKVRRKKMKIGVKSYTSYVYTYIYDEETAYREEASQKIDLGVDSVKILSFNIHLNHISSDSAQFQVLFYSIDPQTSEPQNLVQYKPLLFKQALPQEEHTWFTVDLSDKEIWMQGEVFAAIAFMRYSSGKQSFAPFYGQNLFKVNKGLTYYRSHALGTWKEISPALCIYLGFPCN